MRTQFTLAAAMLASSTMALRINSQSKSEAYGSNCDGFTMPDLANPTLSDTYNGNFDTPAQWYNGMEHFWQIFDADSAFQYFDCGYGNGDGTLEYQEFADGLWQGGFMQNEFCDTYFWQQWNATIDSTSNVTNKSTYAENYRLSQMYIWSDAKGDNQKAKNVSRDWFVSNLVEKGYDVMQATNWFADWDDDEDDVLTKQEFKQGQRKDAKRVWNYWNSIDLVQNGTLTAGTWYLTIPCISADSYWTQLTNNQDVNPMFDSTVSYNSKKWGKRVCKKWNIC